MTIQNKKTGKRRRISPEDWKILHEKDLETAGRGVKYSSLFKILDHDDSTPLDEKQSAEDANVPEVLKITRNQKEESSTTSERNRKRTENN